MKAASTMTREVLVAPPELPLSFAWATMLQYRIRHLPVVAGDRLVGILSDRDILVRSQLAGQGTLVPSSPVSEAMTPSPITCHHNAGVDELAALMVERKIDAIPVLDDAGRVVGLVTSTDLLALLIQKDHARVLPFDFQLRAVGRDGKVEVG